MKKNKQNNYLTEVLKAEKMTGDLSAIIEPFWEYIYSMNVLPNKELENNYLTDDELEKLTEAHAILEKIHSEFYNNGRASAIKLVHQGI